MEASYTLVAYASLGLVLTVLSWSLTSPTRPCYVETFVDPISTVTSLLYLPVTLVSNDVTIGLVGALLTAGSIVLHSHEYDTARAIDHTAAVLLGAVIVLRSWELRDTFSKTTILVTTVVTTLCITTLALLSANNTWQFVLGSIIGTAALATAGYYRLDTLQLVAVLLLTVSSVFLKYTPVSDFCDTARDAIHATWHITTSAGVYVFTKWLMGLTQSLVELVTLLVTGPLLLVVTYAAGVTRDIILTGMTAIFLLMLVSSGVFINTYRKSTTSM